MNRLWQKIDSAIAEQANDIIHIGMPRGNNDRYSALVLFPLVQYLQQTQATLIRHAQVGYDQGYIQVSIQSNQCLIDIARTDAHEAEVYHRLMKLDQNIFIIINQ